MQTATLATATATRHFATTVRLTPAPSARSATLRLQSVERGGPAGATLRLRWAPALASTR